MQPAIIFALFVVLVSAPTFGQDCDCTEPPPYAPPACARKCLASLIANTSAEDLKTYVGLADTTAQKIAQNHFVIDSLYDFQAFLSADEFEKFHERVDSLTPEQIYYINLLAQPALSLYDTDYRMRLIGQVSREDLVLIVGLPKGVADTIVSYAHLDSGAYPYSHVDYSALPTLNFQVILDTAQYDVLIAKVRNLTPFQIEQLRDASIRWQILEDELPQIKVGVRESPKELQEVEGIELPKERQKEE